MSKWTERDRADNRLRHAGYEWLLDGAADNEIRTPKRRAENERGSGSRKGQGAGARAPEPESTEETGLRVKAEGYAYASRAGGGADKSNNRTDTQ